MPKIKVGISEQYVTQIDLLAKHYKVDRGVIVDAVFALMFNDTTSSSLVQLRQIANVTLREICRDKHESAMQSDCEPTDS